MIRSILVPVDGSAHANAAVDLASDIAAKFDASIILLNVISRPGSGTVPEEFRPYAQLEHVRLTEWDLIKAAADGIVEAAARRARANGIANAESITAVGDPARTIATIARDRNVDLIAMGRRGLGDLEGLLLGSVSHKVAHLADRPCLTTA